MNSSSFKKAERRPERACFSGFTLVEMLAVMAIIIILVALVIPGFGAVSRATAMSGSTSSLVDQLNLAREQAVASNRTVEVRFFKVPDPGTPTDRSTDAYRAIQLFRVEPTGRLTALGKPIQFGLGVILAADTNLSSLMNVAEKQASTSDPYFPAVGQVYAYRSLRITANGTLQDVAATGTVPSAQSRFMTLYWKNNAPNGATQQDITNRRVANWSCVQIDPVTSRTKVYRP